MSDAEARAQRLLDKHHFVTAPIPVQKLAELEGAVVVHQRFDGNSTSGFMLADGSGVVIGVNSATSKRRQRFTIAHEIGHMVMHRSDSLMVDSVIQFRDDLSSLGTNTNEREANAFAASLLMPLKLVVKHMARALDAGVDGRDELISRLAAEFDVSSEAMSYRLINLGVLRA
ncbi:protein of unknown function [Frankineae bacterium MT45]|nr:protein of unknown function [Frankineae bacterium MT45]